MRPIYETLDLIKTALSVVLSLKASVTSNGEESEQNVDADTLQRLKVALSVPNVTGERDLIASGECVLDGNELQIDLSNFDEGIYRLVIKAVFGTQTKVLYGLDIIVPESGLVEGTQEYEDTVTVVSTYGDGDKSGADATVYAKDADGNAHITKPLTVSGSVQEGSPYGTDVYKLNVVVLTPEQKAEVETVTGTAYDYCDIFDNIEDGVNVTIYADEECTQKVGSTAKTEYAEASIIGDFFNLQEGESISAGTYYARVERGIIGEYSHAEGVGTTASGDVSHAEGKNTTASGHVSHAEGENTTASGYVSHAEGENTTASGESSHAEGKSTTASGDASHAEGENTTASGYVSHAEGEGTIASKDCQHVSGKYNVEDTNGDYAFIVGNGTEDARSNAFAIDWNGNLVLFNAGTPVVLTPAKLATLIA